MRPFLICAFAGFAISAAGWFAPPGRVTSTAVLTAPGLESPRLRGELEQRIAAASRGLRSREILAGVIRGFDQYPGVTIDDAVETMRRDIAIEPVSYGPALLAGISFRYRGRREAQRVANWLASQMLDSGQGFRLVDPASLPSDHTILYRLAAREFGLPIGAITGLITGLIGGWRRRRIRVPTEILPAT